MRKCSKHLVLLKMEKSYIEKKTNLPARGGKNPFNEKVVSKLCRFNDPCAYILVWPDRQPCSHK